MLARRFFAPNPETHHPPRVERLAPLHVVRDSVHRDISELPNLIVVLLPEDIPIQRRTHSTSGLMANHAPACAPNQQREENQPWKESNPRPLPKIGLNRTCLAVHSTEPEDPRARRANPGRNCVTNASLVVSTFSAIAIMLTPLSNFDLAARIHGCAHESRATSPQPFI